MVCSHKAKSSIKKSFIIDKIISLKQIHFMVNGININNNAGFKTYVRLKARFYQGTTRQHGLFHLVGLRLKLLT